MRFKHFLLRSVNTRYNLSHLVHVSSFIVGTIHAIFEKGNNHYTWKKVTTTVHNIIVGKLWIDQVRLTESKLRINRLLHHH